MSWARALIGLLVLGACHARRVENPATATAPSHHEEARSRQRASHTSPPKDRGSDDETIPVTSAPADLLVEGGESEIQAKLADRGFLGGDYRRGSLDGATGEALKKFQRSKDLPATGVPDNETVRKLGLDPDKLFRRAKPGPAGVSARPSATR